MENASKALLIAGAILLCILIIAIGMYIYNNAESTIKSSVTSMSTQEINAFNSEFTAYEGAQTGSNVKALIGRLIANSDTYKDETAKIPAVNLANGTVRSSSSSSSAANVDRPDEAGNTGDYVTGLGVIRNEIETKHTYWVECTFGTNGIIDEVIIYYDNDMLQDTTR